MGEVGIDWSKEPGVWAVCLSHRSTAEVGGDTDYYLLLHVEGWMDRVKKRRRQEQMHMEYSGVCGYGGRCLPLICRAEILPCIGQKEGGE